MTVQQRLCSEVDELLGKIDDVGNHLRRIAIVVRVLEGDDKDDFHGFDDDDTSRIRVVDGPSIKRPRLH